MHYYSSECITVVTCVDNGNRIGKNFQSLFLSDHRISSRSDISIEELAIQFPTFTKSSQKYPQMGKSIDPLYTYDANPSYFPIGLSK